MMTTQSLGKKALIAASALVASSLAPVVFAHEPGRMTGGGSIFCGDELRVTHGFELHCIAPEGSEPTPPNNLEVNFGGNSFHLLVLETAVCTDDPQGSERPPQAGFDTLEGSGIGRFNPEGSAPTESGAKIEFTLTDFGEPGGGVDVARFRIEDADSNIVLRCSRAFLNQGGNHQAHRITGNQDRVEN